MQDAIAPDRPADGRPPEKPSRWNRARRFAARLGLLLGTLLLLAAVLEIGTRIFSDVVPPLLVGDSVLGKRYLESFDDTVYVPEAGRKIRLRFNNVGFRGPDWPMKKPPGVRRIAVLGDSMIASVAVDEKDTLVGQLQQMLDRSQPETKWEVMNFGVAGSSPAQEMVLYRELVSRFDPDIVLCAFFVGNDLSDNSPRLSNNPRIYFDVDASGELHQLPFSAGRARASAWLNRHSRFYVWQKGAMRTVQSTVMESLGEVSAGKWIFCSQPTGDVAHAWRITDEVMLAFRREVESRHSLFAVVVLPSACQVYTDLFASTREAAGKMAPYFNPDYPDQRLGNACREAGVPLLSMLDDFRAATPDTLPKDRQQWLFHNGTDHFNEKGNALAARAVYRYLSQGGDQQVAQRPLLGRLQ